MASVEPAAASTDAWMLQALFCDESAAFREPVEPGIGQWVSVRLRAEKRLDARAWLLIGAQGTPIPLALVGSDELFSWHEVRIRCGFEPFRYRILVECGPGQRSIVCQKDGAHWADEEIDPSFDFRIAPGNRTPAWAQGAIQYQIFPDRFANGDATNDLVDHEYAYGEAHVRKIRDWNAAPALDDYRCFYGGDLQGVASKLDYLQSIGVEALYLNPIFVSPSSHKYDTQDYGYVDPHFAVIRDDINYPLGANDMSNGEAIQYMRRITSRVNLTQSNELFACLCQEIHRRGMKIILDGVFNHCGSFHYWMDREGLYRMAGMKTPGAYQSAESPFRPYFAFTEEGGFDYEGWWGFPTLPKLNYENSPELCDKIIDAARQWALPPYSIDGWRLDVAADLGHSEEFNHAFWRRFRTELKMVNPDLLILAEHYGDPTPWLAGDQWDSVMNYDAFMDPLSYFLTGMEKHSDAYLDFLYQNGEAFCETMRATMAGFSWPSLLCAMNELSNHDHSRFLTRTNRTVGRTETEGPEAAGVGIDKRVLREAVVVQMTWPGAPTIYYGDEAGQVGWTDPDSRRTYPWGSEDEGLVELHRELARLRGAHESLRSGSLVMLGGGHGWIAFGRFLGQDWLAVLVNNADKEQELCVRARTLGAADGTLVGVRLETAESGFRAGDCVRHIGAVENGIVRAVLPARTAAVLGPLR